MSVLRFFLPLLAMAFLPHLAVGVAFAATTAEEQDAINAAEKWLVPVDANKSAEAWAMSSASFKSAVDRQKWQAGLADLRKPYGRLESRKPAKIAHVGEAPAGKSGPRGVAPGSQVTILFETRFAGGKVVDEEVMLVREVDGVWRVAGYFIRG